MSGIKIGDERRVDFMNNLRWESDSGGKDDGYLRLNGRIDGIMRKKRDKILSRLILYESVVILNVYNCNKQRQTDCKSEKSYIFHHIIALNKNPIIA